MKTVTLTEACRALPMTCRANGLVLKQVKRTDSVAMYSVHFTEDDPPHGYEVFRIRRSKGGLRIFDGKEVFFRDYERMPANEDFGKTAFSFLRLSDAESAYTSMG